MEGEIIEKLKSLFKNDNSNRAKNINVEGEIRVVKTNYKIEDIYHNKKIIDDKLFDTSKCSVISITCLGSDDSLDTYYIEGNYTICYLGIKRKYVMKTERNNYILVRVTEGMNLFSKIGYRKYMIEKVLSIEEVKNMLRDDINTYCRLPRYLTKPRQRRSEWDMAGSDGISRVSAVFRGKSLLTNKMRII